ncbi:MAG: hypothetical protein QGG36_02375 [Pirellulaceae bacterium]|jgi:plastocyanin|nr:hypothetical protein [Pirellulaceae bacterium]
MKIRLLVCVAVGFCLPPTGARGDEGAIEGVIRFKGEAPVSRIADDASERRKLLIVDRKTKGVRDVIAYLDLPSPKCGKPIAKQIVVDQLEHHFVPHLLAIRSGQTVKFTNSDAANHNIRSIAFDERNEFNIYTGVGREYKHVFYAQRKNIPIRLSCDIHPWMSGWIFVFEHSHFAITDEKGKFRIAGLAAGDYELVLRQPDVGYLRRIKVQVEADKSIKREFEFARADLKLIDDDRKRE